MTEAATDSRRAQRLQRFSVPILAGLSILLMAAATLLVWLGRSSPVLEGLLAADYYDPAYRIASVLGSAPLTLIGALIAARRPGNPYGWVWLALGLATSGMHFTQAYAIHGLLVAPGALPGAGLALPLGGVAWLFAVSMTSFVLLLFPTGYLPSRRWRPVAWTLVAGLAVGLAVGWALPGGSAMVGVLENPYGAPGRLGGAVKAIAEVSIAMAFVAVPVSALSVLLRFRRATGVERQQLKWFAYGAAVLVAVMASDFVYTLPGVWETVKESLTIGGLLPATIGIAILRHRLWDIDVVIRRTLVYGSLTATLALVYFGSVTLLQSLFAAISGQRSSVAVVLSTLAIAALFTPLRRRVQNTIDRRFYRRKYDAAHVLAEFGATARDEVELERLTARLVAVAEETMQPEGVGLWLRGVKR